MSLLDVKDRVPTNVLSNDAIRYGVYDEEGKLLRYEYMKREDEPIEEGTAINKVFFGTLTKKAIGYNCLSECDYIDLPLEGKGQISLDSTIDFYPDVIGGMDAKIMQNNNIIAVFRAANDGRRGEFVICDTNGNIIKEPTVFCEAETSHISVTILQNSNVFIAYSHETENKYAFVIYDQEGNLVKSETIFYENAGDVNNTYITTLRNGNVMIAFQDYNNNASGTFVIYDQEGNLVKDKTTFNGGATYYVSFANLPNGNVFIAYQDGASSDYGRFVIYDQDGNLVKGETEFNAGRTTYISVSAFHNGNVLIAFRDTNNSGYGTFVICDQDGNTVKGETVFVNADVGFCSAVTLENGNIFIARQNTATGRGVATIVNPLGTIIFSVAFSGNQPRYIRAMGLPNSEVAIAYYGYTTGAFKGKIAYIKYPKAYDRNYIIDGLSVPQKGEKINLWNDLKESITKKFIETGYSSGVAVTQLNNNNIFFVYQDPSNNWYGTFVIMDANGNVIKEPTVFNANHSMGFAVAKLDNGNVVIAYANNLSNDGKGRFVIYDQDGNLVKGSIQYSSYPVSFPSVVPLRNGNIFFAFINASSTHGMYSIYSQDGTRIKSETEYMSTANNGQDAVLLKNGNVAITYIDGGASYNGKVVIYDQDGNLVKSSGATTFFAGKAQFVSAAVLEDGNLWVAYNNFTHSTYTGDFAIMDDYGNVIVQASFKNSSAPYASISPLKNGGAIIGYQHGAFVIMNNRGVVIKSVGNQASGSNAAVKTLGLEDGGAIIFYPNTVTGEQFHNFSIYNKDFTQNIVSNSINGISTDTLVASEKFYENVYDGEKYLAKEVRV